MGNTGTVEQWVWVLLTSTESTAGKSLLQLTSSLDSCFHTNPGRARTCVTNTAVFLLNWPGLLALLLRDLGSADRVTIGGYSPGTPYPEGQPPSTVRSTHTWQSLGKRDLAHTCPGPHQCRCPAPETELLAGHGVDPTYLPRVTRELYEKSAAPTPPSLIMCKGHSSLRLSLGAEAASGSSLHCPL